MSALARDVTSRMGYLAVQGIAEGLLDEHLHQLQLAINARTRRLRSPESAPPRPATMEDHQVWAWMAGAHPPAWKICGTGLVMDPEANAEHRARRARLAETAERPKHTCTTSAGAPTCGGCRAEGRA